MTGIFKKLRLDNAKKILVVNAPTGYLCLLSDLQYDQSINKQNEGNYDFIQVFATSQAELEKLVKALKSAGKYDCLFWACYPKGGGKIKSDMKRETVWKALEIINLRPVSQIAIDDTWSALRGRPLEVVGK